MNINVAIVDDKQVNRRTVIEKLYGHPDITICFQAKDGHHFLDQCQQAETLPDVVLMDLEMPGMNGIEAISCASVRFPGIRYIVLTIFEDNEKIFDAIKVGANGYLLKEDNHLNLLDAIRNVYEFNGIPMSPAIARKAMNMLVGKESPRSQQKIARIDEATDLSKREIEILQQLVNGKKYKQIAEKLFISPLTVKKHVSNIYEKLHVSNRAQVIQLVHKRGWLSDG
ncbi:MAG: response regulator transcription factor [Bacteroidota bacterium]